MYSPFDHLMMQRALELAERGLYITDPNPRVGCVLVKDEAIVGEGYTSPVGGPHAEIHALRAAADAARGATAYVTLEPCSHFGRTPPCSNALIAAGISRVVYAIGDPNPQVSGGGHRSLEQAGVKVESGLLDVPARQLNVGFFQRMTKGRPWVRVKLGMSLDGKVALTKGEGHWITGEASRHDVQHQRARCSAILTGVGTVLADDPRLTVRAADIDMCGRQPLRVICDTELRCPTTAKIFSEAGPVLVLTASADEARINSLVARGAEVVELGRDAAGGIDLSAALQLLATKGANEVLVEAGPTLAGRFVALGLMDELLLYIAPVLLGADAVGMFNLPSIEGLQRRMSFELLETVRIGGDLRVRFVPMSPMFK